MDLICLSRLVCSVADAMWSFAQRYEFRAGLLFTRLMRERDRAWAPAELVGG